MCKFLSIQLLISFLLFSGFNSSYGQIYQAGIIKQKVINAKGYSDQESAIINTLDCEFQFVNSKFMITNKVLKNVIQYSISSDLFSDQYQVSIMNSSQNPRLLSTVVVNAQDFINANLTYEVIPTEEYISIGKFQCQKINIYSNNGQWIEAHVTSLIDSKVSPLDLFNEIKLNGFPLRYTIHDGQKSVTFETYYLSSNISDIIDNPFQILELSDFKQKHPEFTLVGLK